MFMNVFGPRRSMIQGDEMGSGKSCMTMTVWDMNFRGIAQVHQAPLKPNTPRDRNPLHWPVLDNGKLLGCAPKVGALFISASPNGIEVWVRTFVEMFCGDAAHTHFTDAWKPKLVVLHLDGPKLAEAYGGAANGIHSSMSHQDWAEILPLPNWDNARIAHGQPQYCKEWEDGWVEESSWVPHPAATATEPSPTSTRYIIVSTNQSWRTNVGYVVSDEELKLMKRMRSELNAISPKDIVKRRTKETAISQLRADRLSVSAWKNDGDQPMQATRRRSYKTTSGKPKSSKSASSKREIVKEVVR